MTPPLQARLRTGLPVVAGLLTLWLTSPALGQPLPPDSGPAIQFGSPSLLPDTGTTTRIDSLRQQIEGLDTTGTEKAVLPPGWTVTPSISLRQEWTDHIQGANIGSSFVTAIQPDIVATGDTARLSTVVTYTPNVEIFSASGGQNRVGQNFNASGLVTLVPERLFLDLRGFGALQSSSEGFGPSNTVVLSRSNETQSQSYAATPYFRERFGDWGSGEVGASLAYTSQNSLSNSSSQPLAASTTDQNATSEREYLSLNSGPQFGRFSLNGLASAMQANGTGVMKNAYRNDADLEAGFAATRDITVLAGFGWQEIHYGGFPPFDYNGPQWDIGVHWVPNADSSITVRYGRRDGANSLQLDGSYAPSARSRVYLRYSEGLATDQEELLSAMNASVLDPLGNPVDRQTGAPILLVNNFYGVQNNLSRTKRGSLTGTLLYDRDTIAATVGTQEQQQLAAATLATAGNQTTTSVYGSITWQHEFNRELNGLAFFQYGTNDQSGLPVPIGQRAAQTSTSVVLSVSLTYKLSETLTGLLQYSYTSQSTLSTIGTPPASLIVAGIRKTF